MALRDVSLDTDAVRTILSALDDCIDRGQEFSPEQLALRHTLFLTYYGMLREDGLLPPSPTDGERIANESPRVLVPDLPLGAELLDARVVVEHVSGGECARGPMHAAPCEHEGDTLRVLIAE